MDRELTPREVVAELDKFIVGQDKAKRAVAIAIRNRYRRQLLPTAVQEDIYPKNILMIGPTGVGKTEIARRLARLVMAPFIKVEATKFTEVGYVGRDVESMVRDLVETAMRMVRSRKMEAAGEEADRLGRERLLDLLAPLPDRRRHRPNPLEAFIGSIASGDDDDSDDEQQYSDRVDRARLRRQQIASQLDRGELDQDLVDIEVDDNAPPMLEIFSGSGAEEMGINIQDMLGSFMPRRKKKRRVTVTEAGRLLAAEEAARLVDQEQCTSEAISLAEHSGIIFIDEIDKIAGKERSGGPDVSREGVQRDILPIVEGSTVMTKYGSVRTDHVLFIAAGAFHMSKPADLIPELQGRFPIRVELDSLSREDFTRILVEPENALIKQYQHLLGTEGITLTFEQAAIDTVAEMAVKANDLSENIGARRLHTILERVLDELSFAAPDMGASQVTITREYVMERLGDVIADNDLHRYIL